MPSKKPRVNKSKAELVAFAQQVQKVDHEKSVVSLAFPLLANMKSIYDAQTALNAFSGYVKMELDKRMVAVLVGDLKIDLSKENDSEIKTVMLGLFDLLAAEKAKDTASLMERFGNILAQHSAQTYMKNPMTDITIDKIISK